MTDNQNKSLTKVWEEFSQTTGFHGINKVSNRNIVRCSFWLCAFFACAVYLVYIMCQELQHYYNYPTYTTVEVETHSQIEFPAVTFCNLNSLNKSNIVNDSRIDNYYLSIGPRMLIGFNKSINWSDPFYTEQGFFKKRTEPDILAENKLLYYGLLNIFLFDQKTINSGYEEYFTIKLALNGPCLTSNLTTIFKSSYTGSEYNLVLWLNVDRKNSYFGQWMGEGIQFTVHEKEDDPYFQGSSGYYVEPGHEIYAAVKKYRYEYLSIPFKANPTEFCKPTAQNGTKYVFTQCMKECYVRYIFNACKCIDFKYDKKFYGSCKLKDACICPPSCLSTRYEVTMSSALFPSDFYNNFLLERVGYHEHDYYRKNFIVLHLYFDKLETTVVKQQPVYTSAAEIFGNLGGQMGLFIGASILTVMELGEFLIILIISMLRNNKDGNSSNQ